MTLRVSHLARGIGSSKPAEPASTARARGFTLVEVMMATVIIGLGVLGLLALFAGAARQQQLSTQQSTALQVTQNAAARLATRFGTLSSPDLALLNPNQWYAAKSKTSDHTLTIAAPGGRPIYALVESSETIPLMLYDRARLPGTPPTTGVYQSPGGDYFPGLRAFAQRRIDPDSIELTVTLVHPMTLARTVLPPFRRPPVSARASDAYTAEPNLIAYFRGGVVNSDSRIILDVQDEPAEGTTPASVYAFNLPQIGTTPPNDLILDSIEVSGYLWRNDTLLSLSDRIVTTPDPGYGDSGRRPELAFSVLYRRTATASQLAMITYTLTAPSGGSIYIPPETNINNFGDTGSGIPPDSTMDGIAPIARVPLELAWDENEQSYYAAATRDEAAWAVDAGQLLLVAGDGSVSGSDQAVRVRRRVRGPDDRWRGYLTDSPRYGHGRSYLPSRTAAPVQLDFWAVRDIVQSYADRGQSNGPKWALKPLDIRIIQLGN